MCTHGLDKSNLVAITAKIMLTLLYLYNARLCINISNIAIQLFYFYCLDHYIIQAARTIQLFHRN